MGAEITEEINAKKQTLDADGAAGVLGQADKVYVASCKKILEFDPKDGTKDEMEELLKKATGRTGNLRAPTLRVKNTYYVGFNQEMYENMAG
ncbi:MAG: hypothetical protein CSB24_03180 [Deltaproteobacteria bacterium]|nr:MAG: hypothetical protein CSB24_03180 [Deltaproteobacteria bacterium]